MNGNSGALRGNVGPAPESRQSATAALTADLEKTVARLEADWTGHGVITQDAARDVHELRERAERLFSNWS
jgi:uncharacterized protein YukE